MHQFEIIEFTNLLLLSKQLQIINFHRDSHREQKKNRSQRSTLIILTVKLEQENCSELHRCVVVSVMQDLELPSEQEERWVV